MTMKINMKCVSEPDGSVSAGFVLPPGASSVALQRSRDGVVNETVARKNCDSFASGQRFFLRDTHPPSGKVFYRLQIIDSSGREYFTAYKQLYVRTGAFALNMLKQRRSGLLFELCNPNPGQLLVVIYDSLGNEVSSVLQKVQSAGDRLLRLRLPEGLRTGIYKVVAAMNHCIFSSDLRLIS